MNAGPTVFWWDCCWTTAAIPTQRVTIVAERGEMVKNANGSFLVLENGSIQRHESKQRDPNMIVFDRYAFDLSQFSGGGPVVKYSVRERYLWQLIAPDAERSVVQGPARTVPRRAP